MISGVISLTERIEDDNEFVENTFQGEKLKIFRKASSLSTPSIDLLVSTYTELIIDQRPKGYLPWPNGAVTTRITDNTTGRNTKLRLRSRTRQSACSPRRLTDNRGITIV